GRPPRPYTLLPYTTLFRSLPFGGARHRRHDRVEPVRQQGRDHAVPVLHHELAGDMHGIAKGLGEIDLEALKLAARIPIAEWRIRSEEHTSELQSRENHVCR